MNFTGNYILYHPPHSCIIFDPQTTTTLTLTLDLLNPKSTGFDSVDDYYCAKFQVIPVKSFPHTYIFTYTHTHRDEVIATSAPPYCTAASARIIINDQVNLY